MGGDAMMMADDKKREFAALFDEFVASFLTQPEGQIHLRRYEEGRVTGRANFTSIQADLRRGEDITDSVLRLLLPYTDSAAHRKSGIWIHVAPAIQGDIKEWFQQAGWTRSEDWPKVAKAIMEFVSRCAEDPSSLQTACRDFNSFPYTTGLQTGLLTPILNALRPDDFMIVNNKSRRVINFFTARSFKQRLTDYPATNAAGRALVSDASTTTQQLVNMGRSTDLFDMFSHWLMAVRKYPPVVGQAPGRRIRAVNREVVVTVPQEERGAQETGDQQPEAPDPELRESHRIQAELAKIGVEMGFRVWIPRNDRQKVLSYVHPQVRTAFLEVLPLNYDDITLKTIEQIDVIWLKNRSIARAFEVEHTTAIYSGLLRMADLLPCSRT